MQAEEKYSTRDSRRDKPLLGQSGLANANGGRKVHLVKTAMYARRRYGDLGSQFFTMGVTMSSKAA